MRRLTLYIRQCFCKHTFEKDEAPFTEEDETMKRTGVKMSIYCDKCGYHKSFWKYR